MLQLLREDLCKAVNAASEATFSKIKIAESNLYISCEAADMIRLYHKPSKAISHDYKKAGEIKLIIPHLIKQAARMGSIETASDYRRLGIGHLLVTLGLLLALKKNHLKILVDETMLNQSDVNFWNPIGIYRNLEETVETVFAQINEKMKLKAKQHQVKDFIDGSIILTM